MRDIIFPPYSLGLAMQKSKSWLICGFVALIAACGSQEG
jgi:hypothetical protein